MKFVLIPILMMLVLSQTFSKWVVVMEYTMNREFIVKNLCVNKSKPKLHCKGKCQMMKRLVDEEKQNSSNNTNNSSKVKVPDQVFSDEMNKPGLPLLDYATVLYNGEAPVLKFDAPTSSIFHPPAIS